MSEPTYILVHDIGTTANKTSIFKVEKTLIMVSSKTVEYPLYTLPNGGVEQHAEELWRSIVESTKAVMQQSNIPPEKIKSIVFCAQMVGFLAK